MRTNRTLTVVVTFLVAAVWVSMALAQAPAPDAKATAPAAKAAPHGKGAPVEKIAGEFSGKLEMKPGKNKQGKETMVARLTVTSAKAADGKAMDELKGKTIPVRGKGIKFADYAGKEVTVTGDLVNKKHIRATAIK